MSLDYQKTCYRGTSGDTLKRTTYSKMMQWRDYVEPPPVNPFDGAHNGVFQTVTPVITSPKLTVTPPTHRQEKIPVPPPKPAPENSPTPARHSPRSPPVRHSGTSQRPCVTGDPLLSLQSGMKYRKLAIPATHTGRTLRDTENMVSAPHLNYHKNGGYDDFHRSYLKMQRSGVTLSYPLFGPPRLRNGRNGGGWRHVREVLQAGGKRIVFVEGGPRVEDNTRVAEGNIPGGNIIQGTRRRTKTPNNQIELLKMSAYDNYLTGIKGMERNNWRLIR